MIAQSNNAVDQLVERLDDYRIPVLRLGSQASSVQAKNKTFKGYLENLGTDIHVLLNQINDFVQEEESEISNLIQYLLHITNTAKTEKRPSNLYGDGAHKLTTYLNELFLPEYQKILPQNILHSEQIRDFCKSIGLQYYLPNKSSSIRDIIER